MSSLDPSVKLYRETPCEHDLMESHTAITGQGIGERPIISLHCPGGTREEVVIDYEAAARVWLGDELFDGLQEIDGEWDKALVHAVKHLVTPMFDAALKSAGFTKTFTSEKEHQHE